MSELTIPEMWHKIHYHHKFANSKLGVSLLIDPVMVNPETKRIEHDRSTNTELNYWIEFLVVQPIAEEHRIHYGPRAGEIMHIIYNDNGVTKIKTFGTENLLDDALKGTFNNKTLTKI